MMESWKVIKIVLERCSRTETAISPMVMKKKVKKCDICGCSILNKTESAEDKLSPLQFNLLVTIMGSLEESRRRMEDVPNNSSACANCISRFQTLELLYAEISTLQNKVDDILAQILKRIQDRLKLVDSTETKEVEDPSSKAHLSSISVPPPQIRSSSCGRKLDADKVEDTTTQTFTTTTTDTAFTLEEEDDDAMNIKEELDLDDLDLEPPEEDDPLHFDCDPLHPGRLELDDDPLHLYIDPLHSVPNSVDDSTQRQCKIRAQNVISSILKKDLPPIKPTIGNHDNDDGDENYGPDITDMDSSDSESIQSLLDDRGYGKRKRVRNCRPPKSEQSDTCEICGKLVPDIWQLSRHMETHKNRSEKQTFSCLKCAKTFARKSILSRHIKYVHVSDRPRPAIKHNQSKICKVCGKQVKDLSMHMETHKNRSERQLFPCHHCEKRFTEKSTRYKHIKYFHDKIRPIKCQQCGKEFSQKRWLQNHLKVKHNPDPELAKKRRFICSFCGQGYTTKKNLRIHKLHVHMKEQRIKCTHPNCKNTFCTDSALQHHLQHYHPVEVENKTLCTICNDNFSSIQQKVVHIRRVHEKAFTCKFCDKSYAAKMLLDCHERTHTGDQPYLCTRCGKTFAQHNTLSVHQQVTCNTDATEADKIRKARSKRQMEWRAKKKNSQHKCDFCLKTFLLKERLLAHISKVHNDETHDDDESLQVDAIRNEDRIATE